MGVELLQDSETSEGMALLPVLVVVFGDIDTSPLYVACARASVAPLRQCWTGPTCWLSCR